MDSADITTLQNRAANGDPPHLVYETYIELVADQPVQPLTQFAKQLMTDFEGEIVKDDDGRDRPTSHWLSLAPHLTDDDTMLTPAATRTLLDGWDIEDAQSI